MLSIVEATRDNASFSKALPGLQLAVDSTSLGEFKLCARRYFYSIVLGYQPRGENVHLTFGILLHGARERYDRAKAEGLGHEAALASALAWALEATWQKDLNRPWASDHKTKNRDTLLRSIVWALDKLAGGPEGDPLETVLLTSGKPAVELAFRFETGYIAETGEKWLYCGYMDRLAKLNGQPYVVDVKTTEHTIDAGWFSKFTPGNQFSMYALAGAVAFATPVTGVIVDGLQIGVTFTRVERGLVPRSEAQLEEWHRANMRWLEAMNVAAHDGVVYESAGRDPAEGWPMNEQSCDKWGGCPYRAVCSRPPGARMAWLEADYRRRVWDPLRKRGDV